MNLMDKSIWDRIKDINDSINGGVEPMSEIRLKTPIIKKFLGMFLIQSFIIALAWSIEERAMSPWIIPVISFLQVGWLWNKVTDSWKLDRGYYGELRNVENTNIEIAVDSIQPPNIDIETQPVFGN